MAKTPARPTTTPLGGGKIGLNGTEIWIKAQRVDVRLNTNIANVTGDGDSDPMFMSNGFLYGSISITGWTIQNQSSGTAVAIKAGDLISVTVTLATGRTIAGTVLVHQGGFNWTAEAQNIPFMIAGQFSGAITET